MYQLPTFLFFKLITISLYYHKSKIMLSRSFRAILVLGKNSFATAVYVSVGVVTLFV